MLLGQPKPKPRDELERFYTPDRLAALCLERVQASRRWPTDQRRVARVVEPSCGGGAFVRAARERWPFATVNGFDVDPEAVGLELADDGQAVDFLEVEPGECDVVVGNPPFGPALEHVRRALAWQPYAVAFILPLARLEGTKGWGAFLDEHPPEAVHPIAGRPWPDVVRGCGLWVWHTTPGAFRIMPRITGWKR